MTTKNKKPAIIREFSINPKKDMDRAARFFRISNVPETRSPA
jgi:hypothetical protein